MSKSLVIAEKPSVGKEIARVLGVNNKKGNYYENSRYIISWAYGHLVTHADPEVYDKKYANWTLEDLPILPRHMKLVVIKQTGKQFNAIKQLLYRSDVKEVIIATDAGREGELVARWILEKANVKKPLKRLWISSVTDKAIAKGFKSLKSGKEYEALYASAVARAEGDWIVGINATRALTTKFGTPLSCGRVQTPTVAMVKTREDSIRTFIAKDFYGIEAIVNNQSFKWHDHTNKSTSFDKAFVSDVYNKVVKGEAKVVEIERKQKRQYAQPLYDLTTLQKEAYDRYGYSPKQTLSIMQSLYERHKALTYPRTDSKYLSSDMKDTLIERLEAVNDATYRTHAKEIIKKGIKVGSHIINDAKVSDHHAIIPTEESPHLNALSREEWTIYEMVLQRFMALLMPPHVYDEVRVRLDIKGEHFLSKSKKTVDLGYKALFEGLEKQTIDNGLKKGERYSLSAVNIVNGKTTPPSYFNEGSLLAAMENPSAYTDDAKFSKVLSETGGIGTVATRADIIDKLFYNGLLEKSGSAIRITGKGRQLLDVAPEAMQSPELTAKWELELNAIAKGDASATDFIKALSEYTQKIVSEIKGSRAEFKHDNQTTTPCPTCGKMLLIQKGKNGKTHVCPDRNCGYRKNIERTINARCPECKKKLILRHTESGKLFTCICGFKEGEDAFDKRMKKIKSQGGKRDFIAYQKKIEAEEQKKAKANNPFATALKGFKVEK